MTRAHEPACGTLYSIGHSNHPLETFLQLLKAHAIEVLADVRSQPHSRYAPQFNQEALRRAVTQAGLRYPYLGKELGGRPAQQEFYDATGHVLYAKVAQSEAFQQASASWRRPARATGSRSCAARRTRRSAIATC